LAPFEQLEVSDTEKKKKKVNWKSLAIFLHAAQKGGGDTISHVGQGLEETCDVKGKLVVSPPTPVSGYLSLSLPWIDGRNHLKTPPFV